MKGTTCRGVKWEATTDGKVVWVNGEPGCLARLSQMSGEVFDEHGKAFKVLVPPMWEEWEAAVYEVWGIALPSELRPSWAERCSVCGVQIGSERSFESGDGKRIHFACVRREAQRG